MDPDSDQVGPLQRLGRIQHLVQHSSIIGRGQSGDHDGFPSPVSGKIRLGLACQKCMTLTYQVAGTPFGRCVLAEELLDSDDILLIIFIFYRDESPFHWHRLAHVCQRWRRIVFASPHTLRLFLSCTSSTPVGRTIDCWPPLPLILRFDSWPSYAPEGDDNIVAALQHHDRIRCIELFLTDSLVEKLNTHVTEPFSELVELFIQSESNKPLILPGPRHWSMHLRILHLKRSFLPSLPVLLFFSPNLVCLELHDLPVGFPSPGVLAYALDGMCQLESLSLHCFHTSPLMDAPVPIPSKRPVLPVLTKLHFQEVVEYLGDLVAGIDAPCLRKFSVTLGYLSNSQTDKLSQLGQFLSRTEAQRSHTQVEIQISDNHILIVFSAHQSPSHFILTIDCTGLYNQLSIMTGVFNHFPASLLGLEDLGVITGSLSCRPQSVDDESWICLLCPFSNAARFHLAGNFAKPIMHALQKAEQESKTVLPALHKLFIEMDPHCDWEPLWPDVRSFTALHQLSSHPIDVEYDELPCQCDLEE